MLTGSGSGRRVVPSFDESVANHDLFVRRLPRRGCGAVVRGRPSASSPGRRHVRFRAAGFARSPPGADVPGYLTGRRTRSKGRRYPPDPPRTEEVIAVMRCCGDGRHGDRARGLIAVLWRPVCASRKRSIWVSSTSTLAAARCWCGAARAAAAARSAAGVPGQPQSSAVSASPSWRLRVPAAERGRTPSPNAPAVPRETPGRARLSCGASSPRGSNPRRLGLR
jgi:hypothetical protein